MVAGGTVRELGEGQIDQWLAGPQVRLAIQVPVTRTGGGAGLCAGGLPGITAQ